MGLANPQKELLLVGPRVHLLLQKLDRGEQLTQLLLPSSHYFLVVQLVHPFLPLWRRLN
jgi:hypothetical protein